MDPSRYQRHKPEEPPHLACDQCRKEIPASVADTREGPDYILHFCGIECMSEWQKEHPPGST